MGRKEPPDKPCGCGGPLYEGHAMHTLGCPKLTAPKDNREAQCKTCFPHDCECKED